MDFTTGDTTSAYDAYGNYQLTNPVSVPGMLPGIAATPVSNTLSLANITSSQSYNELTVNKLIIGGGTEITIDTSDDIQQTLDTINAAGGGTLRLSPGTYVVTKNLIGYSSVKIVGYDFSTTTLNFGGNNYNLTFAAPTAYTTGTISSITSGVNVTGSGTSWLANVHAGESLFLGTQWYVIAAVNSDTSITLAQGYGDSLSFPANYRITTPITGVQISDLTIENSTGTAISFTDCVDIEINRCNFIANNVGFSMTNVSEGVINSVNSISSTSDGIQFTNCGLFNITGCSSSSNGGNGVTLNNVKVFPFLFSASTSNTGDGYNCTSVVDSVFKVEASSNGGQGIEFVSGCNENFINDSLIESNTSDGIKLTASSSNNTMGSSLNVTGNGGYGINIAASSDNNNTISVPYFASNTSGSYNDSGTNTNIVANLAYATATGTDSYSGNTPIAVTNTITHGLGKRPKNITLIVGSLRAPSVPGSTNSVLDGIAWIYEDTNGVAQGGIALTQQNFGASAGTIVGASIAPTSVSASTSTTGGTGNASITLNNVTNTTFDIVYAATTSSGNRPFNSGTLTWYVSG